MVSAYPQSLRDDAEFVVVTFIDEKNLQMLLDDNCDQYNTFLLLEETQCNWYLAGSDASYRLDDASLQRDHTYGNDRILQKGILNNNFSLSAHLNISEIEGKWFQLVFWGGDVDFTCCIHIILWPSAVQVVVAPNQYTDRCV